MLLNKDVNVSLEVALTKSVFIITICTAVTVSISCKTSYAFVVKVHFARVGWRGMTKNKLNKINKIKLNKN